MSLNVAQVHQAPTATGSTIQLKTNSTHTFAFADFGFSDTADGDAPLAVKIVSLPTGTGAGTLKLNGQPVVIGQNSTIAVGSIGLLTYVAGSTLANFTFTYQLQDNGLQSGGTGADLSATRHDDDEAGHARSAANAPPVGVPVAFSTPENTSRAPQTSDFGFTDPNNGGGDPPDHLKAVKITTLPNPSTVGAVLQGFGLTTPPATPIPANDITNGQLVFVPVSNVFGAASFTYQVQDDGGTDVIGTAGVDLDPTPRALNVTVQQVHVAPAGQNKSVNTNEGVTYAFKTTDFPIADADGDHLKSIIIDSLPAAGQLTINGFVVSLTGSNVVKTSDLGGGFLYKPAPGQTQNVNFRFHVQDDGLAQAGNLGLDTETAQHTMTIALTAVSNAPVTADTSKSTVAGTPIAFDKSDFPFSDPNDPAPGDAFQFLIITSTVGTGTLTYQGNNVPLNTPLPVSSLGQLIFTPAGTDIGSPYASFTFQVQDDGGTANGGVRLGPRHDDLTVDVTGGQRCARRHRQDDSDPGRHGLSVCRGRLRLLDDPPTFPPNQLALSSASRRLPGAAA